MKLFISRELLDAMQAGTLEPEVAFLNASLVWLLYMLIYFPVAYAYEIHLHSLHSFVCFMFLL